MKLYIFIHRLTCGFVTFSVCWFSINFFLHTSENLVGQVTIGGGQNVTGLQQEQLDQIDTEANYNLGHRSTSVDTEGYSDKNRAPEKNVIELDVKPFNGSVRPTIVDYYWLCQGLGNKYCELAVNHIGNFNYFTLLSVQRRTILQAYSVLQYK